MVRPGPLFPRQQVVREPPRRGQDVQDLPLRKPPGGIRARERASHPEAPADLLRPAPRVREAAHAELRAGGERRSVSSRR